MRVIGTWFGARAAGGAVVVVLLAGCGTSLTGPQQTPEQQLLARPALESASKDYLAMLTEMRTAISGKVPDLRWEKAPSQRSPYPCDRPYADIEGAAQVVIDSDAVGGIPDSSWPAVVEVVSRIAARHGFTSVERLVDKPGDHTLMIYDRWGGTVDLGTQENAAATVFAPCLLTDRARGRISRSAPGSPSGV